MKHLLASIVILISISSCSKYKPTLEERKQGVIFKTDSAYYYGGNLEHFQKRAAARAKKAAMLVRF